MKRRTQKIATQPQRSRARFTREFKLEAVRLLDLGQKPAAQLAPDLKCTGNGDCLTTPATGTHPPYGPRVIYRAQRYRRRMQAAGMCASMGRRGSAYDNTVAESFFSTLKNELVHHCDFETRNAARAAIFSYIELFYNRRRLHQTLRYRSPQQFEQSYADA
jgi:hypothetical protein